MYLAASCVIAGAMLKVLSSELEQIMQDAQVQQDDTWLQQYLSELL